MPSMFGAWKTYWIYTAKQELADEIKAWQDQRNVQKATVNWRFSSPNPRGKLKHLYPTIEPGKV
jgi:hypothetical protein